MVPSHGTGPSTLPGETYFGFTLVPIDDYSCWIYTYAWNPERVIDQAERSKFRKGYGIIAELGPDYVPLRNRSNDFQIDRQAQRTQTFTGVKGLAEQDSMIQHSQGFIADRTRENLAASDAAVVRFRRTVLEAARGLAQGREPEAPHHHALFKTRPGTSFSADDAAFEDVMQQRFGNPLGRVG